MSAFGDQLLLRFLQDAFVDDLLTKQLGLQVLLNLTYQMDDIDLKEIVLGGGQCAGILRTPTLSLRA
jgi:hypothetical protein